MTQQWPPADDGEALAPGLATGRRLSVPVTAGGSGRTTRSGTRAIGLVLAALFMGVMTTTVLTIAIWPGEVKLTRAMLCPDDRPEAWVVADTFRLPGETRTNYTMYCMGPRGETTDVGFGRPFLLVTGAHTMAWLLLLGWLTGRAGRRRRGGAGSVTAGLRDAEADFFADR